MMFRMIITLTFLVILSSLSPASAEEKAITADFSTLKQTGYENVSAIIDGQTIAMKSGKIIRLAAINIPQNGFEDVGEYGLLAKQKLESILPPNTKVTLYQTKTPKMGRVNRMDQHLAHIALTDNQWVQGVLLHEGLARAEPTETNPELAAEMYKYEAAARSEKRGLWADENFAVLNHEEAIKAEGNFAIIEGRIKKAASVKNNLYLNFGENWRNDFTVTVSSKIRKKMVRAGLDPLALQDVDVRVRGWVREYNGPMIDLNHPASLEIITQGD